MNKSLRIFIGILLLTSASAYAADIKDAEQGITYTTNGTTVYVSAYTAVAGHTDIVIPETVKNSSGKEYAVTAIGKSSASNAQPFMGKNLTSIIIEAKIDNLGQSAFQGCTKLTKAVLPDGLTVVNQAAFRGCTVLKDIELPESVTKIYSNAFTNCSALEFFRMPPCNQESTVTANNLFTGCTSLKTVELEGPPSLLTSMFEGCTALESVIFFPTVKGLGTRAFYGCNNLKDFYFMPGIDKPITGITNGNSSNNFTSVPVNSIQLHVADAADHAAWQNIVYNTTTNRNSVYKGVEFSAQVGVENVGTPAEETLVQYYDLTGRPVADPHQAPGIYMRRANGRTDKILVR